MPGLDRERRGSFERQTVTILHMVYRSCAALVLVLLICAPGCQGKKISKRAALQSPNVLLITIDTLRPDHLSCYGGKNRTPNIDSIARSGLLFKNAFSQVPLTLPSHTAILTGLFPSHHGVHQNGLER